MAFPDLANSACPKLRHPTLHKRHQPRPLILLVPSRRMAEMEIKISSLDGAASGSVDLPDAIFGLEPRADILQRCVRWQLAKRQSGTHDVKNRAEINRTGKKLYRQKGTGSAPHGPAHANLFPCS